MAVFSAVNVFYILIVNLMAHQFKDSLQLSIQYIKYKQLSEDRQGTDNIWLKELIIIINLYTSLWPA